MTYIYIGQALFQLKFGSVHHFNSAIFPVSILHEWNTQVDAASVRAKHAVNAATVRDICS